MGQLKAGANELEIEVIPDNGYDLGVVYFIRGDLNYSVATKMKSDVLTFEYLLVIMRLLF